MVSEERKKYMVQYNKDNRVRISLNLHKENDKELIEAIRRADPKNIQGAVKTLLNKALAFQDKKE